MTQPTRLAGVRRHRLGRRATTSCASSTTPVKRLTQLRVTHDVAGLACLDDAARRSRRGLPVAVERSEGLLVEHLQARGHAVFPVSPRISARARERYRVAAVKDDRFDAFVLADTLRHEHRTGGRWRSRHRCWPRSRR